MKNRLSLVLVMLAFWASPAAPGSRAAVVMLANRTKETVRFTVSSAAEKARDCTLQRGEVLPIPAARNLEMDFLTRGVHRQFHLRPNAIYYFLPASKGVEVRQLGFTGVWSRAAQSAVKEKPAPEESAVKTARFPVKVPVKILVDQAEVTVQKVWEKRLRARIVAASAILEQHCRVQLEVVAVGTWESDNRLTTLSEMLGDFQHKVTAKPARLAIGFTGRLAPKEGDHVLGCTRGPLHPHILIRERKPRTEAERLEVLVHEVGHFLGACHSPERDSVMRPNLADGRANLRSFRIGFDPINALAMNIVAEEMARGPVGKLTELSAGDRKYLVNIYATVARGAPDDPAAPHYIRLLGETPPEPLPVRTLPDAAVEGARSVVGAVAAAAARNDRLPPAKSGESEEGRRLSGDALTVHYCRIAAEAARRLPAEHAAHAYLLGLAVAVDRDAMLRSLNLPGIPWEKIETDAERVRRLLVLGEPTLHGRRRLAQHFFVSAALLVLVEGQAISAAGVQEELLLIQGGNEFRFDDLSAGLAGILFATQLNASPALLGKLAKSFRIADFVLDPKELSEPLSREEFAHEYGSTTDERFLKQQDILRKRLLALPGYQPQ